MEKNITKQDYGTIAITIYAQTNQTAGIIASNLAAQEISESKKYFEVTYKSFDLETALSRKNKFAEDRLIIIAVTNAEDATVKNLTAILNKKGANYVVVTANENMLTDEVNDVVDGLKKAIQLGFTIKDYTDICDRGIGIEKIESQLNTFKNGIGKITLKKPAVINDGIFKLPKKSAEEYAAYFESKKDNFKLTKFVPASGAATRMFKFLNEFMINFNPEEDTINAYINRKGDTALNTFLVGLDKFPFYNAIMDVVKQNPNYSEWSKSTRTYNFIKTMLQDERFDFANKPKGILPFHQYHDFIATPVCEHLKESVAYAASQNKTNVHFTISDIWMVFLMP